MSHLASSRGNTKGAKRCCFFFCSSFPDRAIAEDIFGDDISAAFHEYLSLTGVEWSTNCGGLGVETRLALISHTVSRVCFCVELLAPFEVPVDVKHHEKKRSAWKSVVMFVILFVCLFVLARVWSV